jgi:hypothetical protein
MLDRPLHAAVLHQVERKTPEKAGVMRAFLGRPVEDTD